MKTIYTKYSNDRSPEYQIRTDIILNDDGTKTVKKCPVNELAKGHIEKLLKNYIELEKCFEQTKMFPNIVKKCEDGVEFEYINGKTLEEILDELFKKEDFDSAKRVFQEFLDCIDNASVKKFKTCDEFEKVFGKWELQGEYECMPVTNIDIIFPNILVDGDKWNIIDYEWTYDFLIPTKYVLFRTIHYYLSFGREEFVGKNIDMYKMAEISEKERNYFLSCEENFQKSLMRDYYALWQINDAMNSRIYYPYGMFEKKSTDDAKKNGYVILYSDGKAVDRFDYMPNITDEGKCIYQFSVNDNIIDRIEIYPYDGRCSIKIEGIIAKKNDNNKLVPYTCNGQEIDNNSWAFFLNPCIVVDDFDSNIDSVYIEYTVNSKEPRELMRAVLQREELINQIDDYKDKIGCQNKEIIELSNEVEDYKTQLSEEHGKMLDYKRDLDEIVNSKVWKLVAPIRKINSLIKR